MILVYIENSSFLKKIIALLEEGGIAYTTNFKDDFDIVLLAEFNKKTRKMVEIMKENRKRVYFLTHLEEPFILQQFSIFTDTSTHYRSSLYAFLNQCSYVITSFPYTAKLLKKKLKLPFASLPLEPVIPSSLNSKKLRKQYHLPLKKKVVLWIDFSYQYIEWIPSILAKYPEDAFIYVGYAPDYQLLTKKRKIKQEINGKVTFVPFLSIQKWQELLAIADLVLYLEESMSGYPYLLSVLHSKTPLCMLEEKCYEGYFTHGKESYLFDSEKELLLRFHKLSEKRVADLTFNGFDLAAKSEWSNLVKYFTALLR